MLANHRTYQSIFGMSSGSDGNSDHADSSGGSDQADSDGSSDQSSSTTSSDAQGHELLGPCPFGHDNNRDCRCDCEQCPNRRLGRIRSNGRRDRNLPPLTRVGILRRIRREIVHRIQEGGYFRAEEDRIDHGEMEVPYHTETVGVPSHPPRPVDLRSNDPTRGTYIGRLHGDAFLGVSAGVGGFGGIENATRFPSNRQDHHSLTIALGQRPCTEMIPWNSPVANWTDPCPRDRRNLGDMPLRAGNQRGQSWPCHETNCQIEEDGEEIQRYDHNQEPLDSEDEDKDEDFKDDWQDENEEEEPGRPETHNDLRWVCRYHKEDAEGFWEHENLLEAHRVPTCADCNAEYRRTYPLGHNSCTCPNLLGRWQCRRCFEKKVRRVQTHFRQRVGAHYTGEADFDMISSNFNSNVQDRPDLGPGLSTYHWDEGATGWRQVRRMLIARHPCIDPGLSRACGRRRVASHDPVLHCRSCGGVVVPPTINTQRRRTGTRSGRQVGARRQQSPLQELTFPRRTRGARGNRFGTAVYINGTTTAGTDGTAGAPGTDDAITVTTCPTAPDSSGTTTIITAPTVPGTDVTITVTTGPTALGKGGTAGVKTGPTASGTGGTTIITAGPPAPGTGGTAGGKNVPNPPGQPQPSGQPACPQQ